MHGIIHSELKRFVVENYDLQTWHALLQNADLQHKYFLTGEAYPDEDAQNIVATASVMTGIAPNDLLEAFGKFIVPTLLKLYNSLISKNWKTEDLLLNTEETIHRIVRMRNPGAQPPQLEFERLEFGHLKFVYTSKRKMSSVAIGIMKAIAKHYDEQIEIKIIEQTEEQTIMDIRIY